METIGQSADGLHLPDGTRNVVGGWAGVGGGGLTPGYWGGYKTNLCGL